MSLEGLRAWIAEVERKLGKRTRVFLALAVIAIGIAAAAVYLAIDARNSSVSESDVQALQEKLEERIDEVGAGGAGLTPPVEPEPELEPAPAPEPAPGGNGASGDSAGGNNNGDGGGGGTGGGTGGGASGTTPGGASNNAKLQELLQQAKERSEENE